MVIRDMVSPWIAWCALVGDTNPRRQRPSAEWGGLPTTLRRMEQQPHRPVRVERRPVSEQESRRANGPDWDGYADEYQATHGEFLGDVGFLWGPEGLTEEQLRILGSDLAGKEVLEVGSGAGQCSRWLASQG